jgi:hypothetical protein
MVVSARFKDWFACLNRQLQRKNQLSSIRLLRARLLNHFLKSILTLRNASAPRSNGCRYVLCVALWSKQSLSIWSYASTIHRSYTSQATSAFHTNSSSRLIFNLSEGYEAEIFAIPHVTSKSKDELWIRWIPESNSVPGHRCGDCSASRQKERCRSRAWKAFCENRPPQVLTL